MTNPDPTVRVDGHWAKGPWVARRAGADGPRVVLVHSSGMGARQWLRLLGARADRWQLWAPNLVGYGGTGPWQPGTNPLADDQAVVEALLDDIGGEVHLVGHSYGATVAARVAAARPDRVRSLVLIEPVDFTLIEPDDDVPEMAMFDTLLEAEAPGGPAWMGGFIDYWNRPGFWRVMSPAQQGALLAVGDKVAAEVHSVVATGPLAGRLGQIAAATLVARGERTTPGARVIAERVAAGVAGSQTVVVPRAGHMFPLSRHRALLGLLDTWIDANR